MINQTPALSDDGVEEQRLLGRWTDHRDLQARGELLRRLLPVARGLARRYEASGEPVEDLAQVASIGLMKAVDRFDPARGVPLRYYAARFAEGELRHYVRDNGGLLRVPRALYECMQRVRRSAVRVAVQLRRAPTSAEVAVALELTHEEVTEALGTARAIQIASLEENGAGLEGRQSRQGDRIGAEDPGFELVEQRSVIERVWRSLDPSEREAIRLRHVDGLTYPEIADRLGISISQVVRIVERSSKRLRTVLRASDRTEARMS